MIIQKTIEKNGNGYILYYSDKGYRIYQVETGNIYNSALDNILANYTYEETN
jgi:hypothetical protein